MKCVVVERPIRDVDGVFRTLRRAPTLPVISVGSDAKRTYVYLPDASEADPSQRVMDWEDAPELMAAQDGEEPFCDGISKGRIAIIYGEPFTKVPARRFIKISARSKAGLALSSSRISLRKGKAILEVGPATAPMEDVIELWDPWSRVKPVSVALRFTAPPLYNPDEEETRKIPKVNRPSVWRVFRRILKI